MRSIVTLATILTGIAASMSSGAMADIVYNDDVIISKDTAATILCLGQDCVDGEIQSGTFDGTMRFRANNSVIEMEDTSGSTFPDRSWHIRANETTGGDAGEAFFIRDATAGVNPFYIEGGAPGNTLFLGAGGDIGLGTSMPLGGLHISKPNSPTIRMDQNSSGGFPPYVWDMLGNHGNFYIRDVTGGGTPFVIVAGAPIHAMRITGSGDLGLGTPTPLAALHLVRSDGTARLRVEELLGTANPRTLLNLQNNGRPEIVMGNVATNGEWSFGAGTDFFLKVGTVGSVSNEKTKVFTVKGNGDAIVAGTLTTGGGTCGGGCDRVFAADYDLPTIEQHAEAMYRLGHLPNVGPTIENEPINVSDKLGRVLNELEHAHIYIAELEAQDRMTRQRMAEQDARIDALRAGDTATRQALAELTAQLAALRGE